MSRPRLIYFDAPVSRGEECRLALWLAGVDFEDVRLPRAEWPALKPTTPYGGLPVLELPGRPPLAQSTAILVYVGRQHGLHPQDAFEAARHEAMLAHAEELRTTVGVTLRVADPEERRRAREALASGFIPAWAGYTERQLGAGPFFGGERIHVVDLKLAGLVRWFVSGTLDHIPADVLDPFPRLLALHAAVRAHPGVQAWYART